MAIQHQNAAGACLTSVSAAQRGLRAVPSLRQQGKQLHAVNLSDCFGHLVRGSDDENFSLAGIKGFSNQIGVRVRLHSLSPETLLNEHAPC